MSAFCTFVIGNTYTNREIIDEFKCGYSGGMRRSKATNSLVLICDHSKSLYDDKWIKDVLHYTGMGKNGDQELTYGQNSTLAESPDNGVELHLFEVFQATKYIYRGEVVLQREPYTEKQEDEKGELRKVYIFPLSPKVAGLPVDKELLDDVQAGKEKKVSREKDKAVFEKAKKFQSRKVSQREAVTKVYSRDPYVSEYAKRKANGECQLCEKPAPFNNAQGAPYLETHHLEWLSRGGSDTLDNIVALCPNCHRKMHVLDLKRDKESLKAKIMIREKD